MTAMTVGEMIGVLIVVATVGAGLVWLVSAPVLWVAFCNVCLGVVLWAGVKK